MSERENLAELIVAELDQLQAVSGRGPDNLRSLLAEHLIDAAEILDNLEASHVFLLFDSMEKEAQAVLMEEASEPVQELLVEHLKHDDRKAGIIEEMAPDDVADIIDELTEEEQEEVLDGVHSDRADQIRELARFDPDSAGGLMTPEFLAVDEDITVQSVKDLIRGQGKYEAINNIYVVRDNLLVGCFSSRELLIAENNDTPRGFMTRDVISVNADADAEECFRIMEGHHLLSLPVVDRGNSLLGMITFDDVMTSAEEEASEDVFKIAGSGDVHPTRDSIVGRVRKRIPYLLISILGGFGSAAVMKATGHEDVADLMFFLPMVLMLGGNIAQQSSAVMVRGFATGEVESGRIFQVVLDELFVGVALSVLCAALGGGLAYMLGDSDSLKLARTVIVAIPCLAVISSLLGTMVPTAFFKLDMDPANGAGPVITTSIDIIGIAVYLGFASYLINAC